MSQLYEGRGYGLITWEEVMSQLIVNHHELTRVGIELLGQLKTNILCFFSQATIGKFEKCAKW